MISASLRERIKELMVDFGLNQAQLAEKTGIGVSTISGIISQPKADSKAKNVKLSTLVAIAKALGCRVHIDFQDLDYPVAPVAEGW